MYGPNWASASATPFNRHKFTGFEGGIRVPAFAHYPKKVAPGTRTAAVGTVMDLLPTFLALAGAQHPGDTYRGKPVQRPRGTSLLPVLYGQSKSVHPQDEVLGWELFGHRTVRQGDWKLVWDAAPPAPQRKWQLFDVRRDFQEQRDLSQGNPQQATKMQAAWDTYARDTGVVY
jgi:arylsulfatase